MVQLLMKEKCEMPFMESDMSSVGLAASTLPMWRSKTSVIRWREGISHFSFISSWTMNTPPGRIEGSISSRGDLFSGSGARSGCFFFLKSPILVLLS